MRLKEVEIKRLADFILERLVKKGIITIKTDSDDIRKRIAGVIEGNLSIEEELDREVDGIIDQHLSSAGGDINRRKLFQMIKKKIAAERGIIL